LRGSELGVPWQVWGIFHVVACAICYKTGRLSGRCDKPAATQVLGKVDYAWHISNEPSGRTHPTDKSKLGCVIKSGHFQRAAHFLRISPPAFSEPPNFYMPLGCNISFCLAAHQFLMINFYSSLRIFALSHAEIYFFAYFEMPNKRAFAVTKACSQGLKYYKETKSIYLPRKRETELFLLLLFLF